MYTDPTDAVSLQRLLTFEKKNSEDAENYENLYYYFRENKKNDKNLCAQYFLYAVK